MGKGAQGEVHRALHFKTNEVRAIKIIDKAKIGKHNWNMIVSEIEILRKIDHPNIVKIYEFFESITHFYIVMEYCKGKLLFKKVDEKGKVTEKEAAAIVSQVLGAVHYLHSNKVVHMDLKSENIIYNGKQIKLIDFGLSQVFNPNKKMKELKGTKYYLAPEIITKNYNHKCDIWAVGVLLFMLMTGKIPFKGDSEKELFENIMKQNFTVDLKNYKHFTPNLLNIIDKMLTFDKDKRPEAAQLLKHRWFCKVHRNQMNESKMKYVQNMYNFNFKNKLQQGIFYYFINNLVSQKEHEKISEVFKILDKNQSGEISKEELEVGLNSLGKKMTPEELDRRFMVIDVDGSGTISYMEFVAAAFNKDEFLEESRLKKLFGVIDIDSNGKISISEFKELFNQSNFISDQELILIVKENDKDQDGELNFKEFKKFMLQMIAERQFSSLGNTLRSRSSRRMTTGHTSVSRKQLKKINLNNKSTLPKNQNQSRNASKRSMSVRPSRRKLK